jgi:hypothetical protein
MTRNYKAQVSNTILPTTIALIFLHEQLRSYEMRARRDKETTILISKMAVFWVVAPCSLVQVYRRFRGICCLHHQGDHRFIDPYKHTR